MRLFNQCNSRANGGFRIPLTDLHFRGSTKSLARLINELQELEERTVYPTRWEVGHHVLNGLPTCFDCDARSP